MTTDRRNAVFLIALEVLWSFGAAFITGDILAALIYSQGGGPTLMAVVTICVGFFGNAPQLLVPYLEQRIAHPVRGAALSQTLMVIGWALIPLGLAILTSNRQLLAVIVTAEVVVGLCAALNYPFYQQTRMRLFPTRTRAKSYSTLLFSSQVAGMLGAGLCVPVLNAGGNPTQHNFLICYAIAGGMFVLSTLCYLWLRDPNPPPPLPATRRPLSAFLREYVDLFRADRNLRWLFASESCAWLSNIGGTFATYSAVQRFGENIAAQCNLVRCVLALLAVPVAHYVVTRWKPRAAMMVCYASALTTFACLLVPGPRALAVVAIGLGGATMVFRVNFQFHFVASMASDANRTRYFALSSAMGAPFILASPLIGTGLLRLTNNNYAVPFGVSMVVLVFGLLIVWKRLQDPVPTEAEVGVTPRVTLKRLTQ